MEVYALIGQSGTGKSYKAFMVAKDKDAQYIIDDGLLIGGTRVITGNSAKKRKLSLLLFAELCSRMKTIEKQLKLP